MFGIILLIIVIIVVVYLLSNPVEKKSKDIVNTDTSGVNLQEKNFVRNAYVEKFSGNITNNMYPDKEIIVDNNTLNNLYMDKEYTDNIIMDSDNNTNNYYQDQEDSQMLGQYGLLRKEDIDLNKYYDIYKHQLKCPCDNTKELGFESCQNDLDVFKISNMAMTNNKNKSCVSCNFNNLNDSVGATLTKEQQKIDMNMVKKNTLVNNNVDKFSEYKDFVNQDSNQFETQVDKLGQCRSSGVCELNKFGDTIWNAYDNLLSTDFTKYQVTTNPEILTGANNSLFGTNYERIPSINYNIDKQL